MDQDDGVGGGDGEVVHSDTSIHAEDEPEEDVKEEVFDFGEVCYPL